jgi:hypothetical protein
MVFEHVVSFALKETLCRHLDRFRMADDTTEIRETSPSWIWKRDLGLSSVETPDPDHISERCPTSGN